MSMPRAKMRGGHGYVSSRPGEGIIETNHSHYNDRRVSDSGPWLICPCVAHGPGCTVGLCETCWLYKGKKTITHFMPTLPYHYKGRGKNKKGRRNK